MNKKLKVTEKNNISTTTCSYDCGGRSLLEVHARDNKVIKIRSKNAPLSGEMSPLKQHLNLHLLLLEQKIPEIPGIISCIQN